MKEKYDFVKELDKILIKQYQEVSKTRRVVCCMLCGSIIYSFHRHDYKECSCGNVAVDGGKDYCRMNWKDPSKILVWDRTKKDWVKFKIN